MQERKENPEAEFEFTAGRLMWTAVRNVVSDAKFRGAKVNMWEGEGFLSRPFIIRGEPLAVQNILTALRALATDDC